MTIDPTIFWRSGPASWWLLDHNLWLSNAGRFTANSRRSPVTDRRFWPPPGPRYVRP